MRGQKLILSSHGGTLGHPLHLFFYTNIGAAILEPPPLLGTDRSSELAGHRHHAGTDRCQCQPAAAN